jgi:hypothetical protein
VVNGCQNNLLLAYKPIHIETFHLPAAQKPHVFWNFWHSARGGRPNVSPTMWYLKKSISDAFLRFSGLG